MKTKEPTIGDKSLTAHQFITSRLQSAFCARIFDSAVRSSNGSGVLLVIIMNDEYGGGRGDSNG